MFITPAYAQAPGGGGDFFVQMLPFIAIILIMYFLILRPQQKKLKEHRDMVAGVRRGDTVVTSGGIIGKVVKVEENELQVEIAPGVKVKVLRNTLSDVFAKGQPAKADKDKK
ncbi:MAG: preprotein translocase subunit YajC [Methyloligellaceae bacterium]